MFVTIDRRKGGSNVLQTLIRIMQNRKGQSLVELALVLPMVLFLLMGVVEFGRLFHTYLITTQGSREGARLAVVGASDTAVVTKVEQVTASLDLEQLNVFISPGEKERIRGTSVVVQVNYSLDLLIPNIFDMLPDPFIVSSETVMRME